MNPYYIPPGPAPLTGLANNILALSELRQRGQIAEQNQLNEAEQLAQGRERNEILRLDAENKQKQWERENPHLQNYGGNQHVELVTTFKRLGLPNSEFVKESERMTQNPETTRGQAYLRIRGMKGVLQKEIQDELIKKADDPTFTGSEREQTLKTILDCIGQEGGYDALIDEAFPDVSQIYRAEEAKQNKDLMTGAKPYLLKDGQWTMIAPGQAIPEGAVPESVGKREPKSEFQAFYDGMKQQDPNITDLAISDAWQARQLDVAGKRAQININMGGADPFSKWAPEEKQFFFDQYLSNGTMPQFGRGDNASRRQFQKEMAAYANGKGIDGFDIQVNKADYGALKGSLNFQQKSFNMASSFANNLNGQLNKVDKLMQELNRSGIRAVDLPLRTIKTKIVGSGNERVLDSYLTEISNEIGKLSTGSQASVAELSIGAQEKWNQIHDPNLSLGELRKVLDATREQANIRMKSLKTELDKTRQAIRNIGKDNNQEPGTDNQNPLSKLETYLMDNREKSSQKALYQAAIKAGWKKDDIFSAWRNINGR